MRGGVVQVDDSNYITSAHVEGDHVVQVGNLIIKAHSQVQGESLRKVIVNRGMKRRRS